jgi:hypothetical protein
MGMRFERKEVVLLGLGVLLAVAGLMVDDIVMVAVLLSLAAILGCYAAWAHQGRGILFKASVCLVIVVATGGAFTRMYVRFEQKELTENIGTFVPANEPRPQIPYDCLIPSDALAAFWGSSNVMWADHTPYMVLVMRGQPIFVLDRKRDGKSLSIKILKLFDDRGDNIVHIDPDKFWVRPDVRLERPDKSTLIVYDHTDSEAIHVRLMNSNTLYLTGTIRYPGAIAITITDDAVSYGNIMTTHDSCMGGGTGNGVNIGP